MAKTTSHAKQGERNQALKLYRQLTDLLARELMQNRMPKPQNWPRPLDVERFEAVDRRTDGPTAVSTCK